jgi:hypothetical protein
MLDGTDGNRSGAHHFIDGGELAGDLTARDRSGSVSSLASAGSTSSTATVTMAAAAPSAVVPVVSAATRTVNISALPPAGSKGDVRQLREQLERRDEKIHFYENHTQTLTADIQVWLEHFFRLGLVLLSLAEQDPHYSAVSFAPRSRATSTRRAFFGFFFVFAFV